MGTLSSVKVKAVVFIDNYSPSLFLYMVLMSEILQDFLSPLTYLTLHDVPSIPSILEQKVALEYSFLLRFYILFIHS